MKPYCVTIQMKAIEMYCLLVSHDLKTILFIASVTSNCETQCSLHVFLMNIESHDSNMHLMRVTVYFPQVQQMLDQLNGEWVSFQQCLIDSDVMLKKSKEKFKTGLIHSSEDFKKTVTTLFDDFQTKGPFSSSISVTEVCMWYYLLCRTS